MHKTTRISIDFPHELHVFLKMFCAKKGISIRQFILDTVLNGLRGNVVDEVDDKAFKKAADKLMKDKSALWKGLAKR